MRKLSPTFEFDLDDYDNKTESMGDEELLNAAKKTLDL
jgi:hypothetical protein